MANNQVQSKRHGFTLVELLVVITIIAILASLVLFGAQRAMVYVRQATIVTEIDNIAGSMQEYKSKYGEYPPNAVVNTNPQRTLVLDDLKRHFKKAFPNHQEPDSLFLALVNLPSQADASPAFKGLSASEAVVFWLGGFSSDARYPISGKGGPSIGAGEIEDLSARNFVYGFDQSRLGPRNQQNQFIGRVLTYSDPVVGSRKINLWTYAGPRETQPYVYFDTSRLKPVNQQNYDPISNGVVALKTGATAGPQLQYANAGSFQILHPGLDNSWGDQTRLTTAAIAGGNGLVYPTGPFTADLADNLVNFSRSPLQDSEP
jgi:prepilin-type N-terminal cleavage/methylation domain-containing protein